MRALQQTIPAQLSPAAVVMRLCEQSENGDASFDAETMAPSEIERQYAATNRDLHQAVHNMVSAPLRSMAELKERADALAAYLAIVGSEDHDDLVKEGLRGIAEFTSGDRSA